MYNRSLHVFSIITAVCTFLLIIAGGLVTSTGSGLAVPDWPLSYGKLMPPMVGGILYEHSHRMIASLVGLLTIVLTAWIWKKESRRWLRILAVLGLLAVVTQGVLGGLTVLFLLPTPISVGHATLAQTFFCIVASIALFTSRWWLSNHPEIRIADRKPSLLVLCVLTSAAVYIQLILGALMRHTESGLAVPDFPLAFGQVFPSLSPESLAEYNRRLFQLEIRAASEQAVTAPQIVIHLLHRYWAVVVVGMIVWTYLRGRAQLGDSKRMASISKVLLGLVVLQVTLGSLTVVLRKAVDVTTAHVAVGALLLMASVILTLHVGRVSGTQLVKLPVSSIGEEAIA